MALIDIDIDNHLDEADTESIIHELTKRKVDVFEIITRNSKKLCDQELLNIISWQKQLSLQQTDRLEHFFKNL